MEISRCEIPGSELARQPDDRTDPLPADQRLTATIVLRPQAETAQLGEELLSGSPPPSREEAERLTGADPATVSAVEDFARRYGLQVTEADAAKRTVKLSGTASQFEQTFGVQLFKSGDTIGYRGPITVPSPLAGNILAVLGLDTRAVARPRDAYSS